MEKKIQESDSQEKPMGKEVQSKKLVYASFIANGLQMGSIAYHVFTGKTTVPDLLRKFDFILNHPVNLAADLCLLNDIQDEEVNAEVTTLKK